MQRWKLFLEYDGTGFWGWQRQDEGRTVQKELEIALSTFCQMEITVHGQGRTDRGVHAEGQVAHTDLPDTISSERLRAAMLGLLPLDMSLLDAIPVSSDFHARFHAVSRSYRYQITLRPHPLQRHTNWAVLQPLNIDILDKCAELVVGEQDFKNFSKQQSDDKSTICLIKKSIWQHSGQQLLYRIEGNRFLRHMVRRLVGSMKMAATGKLSTDDFEQLLFSDNVVRKGHSAPPEGLILESVSYD